MRRQPRVAFCTDTFDEINGVATISRQYEAYARRNRLPFLLVRPGPACWTFREGSTTIVEIARSRCCLPLDMGLRFDLLISRHYNWLRQQLTQFAPDIVHITGPGDIGMLATAISHRMRVPKVPLVASWHTNVHQYARLRCLPLLRLLPESLARSVGNTVERGALRAAGLFYRTARITMAPNADILGEVTQRTRRPGYIMPHGVDTDRFKPSPFREAKPITIGYVGRLSPEKNVRFLADVARQLPVGQVRFLIVGDGSERAWLESHLPKQHSRFTGVLRGAELARAYSDMDLFLFPSQSDTFGLVVLEAMSSGLPVVSFRLSGPKSAVDDGHTGFTAPTPGEFVERVEELVANTALRRQFREAGRAAALGFAWDPVFEAMYQAYETLLPEPVESVVATGPALVS